MSASLIPETPVPHPVAGWEDTPIGPLATAAIDGLELLEGDPPLLRVRADGLWYVLPTVGGTPSEEHERPEVPQPVPPSGVVRATSTDPSGSLWAATDDGLWRFSSGVWAHYRSHDVGAGLLDNDLRDVKADGRGHLWIATPRGVSLFLPPRGWESLTAADGLPVEDITCIAMGRGGDRWLGTPQGLVRLTSGRWEYYGGRRWLPEDRVTGVAVGPDGSVYVATLGGLGRLRFVPLTLEQKAQRFEEVVRKRHWRLGYVASNRLQRPGDLESFIYEATDNDGLWTAIYLAAECFRFAATGDPEAKGLADGSAGALMALETCSTLEGFPARARVTAGERVVKSDGEWHPTRDGEGEWKADTSSDELDGHYFGLALYYGLVADEEAKGQVRQVVARITDHLLANDYALIDVDGRPTRWAVHGPAALNDDPAWVEEKGLNSLEILSHLRVAHHITGDGRYEAAYQDLVRRHHYALNTLRQKRDWPYEINHSDDELAFLAYYSLLRYETDPDLRALYLLSLERSWRIEQPEASPFFDFIYAACTGHRDGLGPGRRALEEIPLDLVTWTMTNSHRVDLKRDTRFRDLQSRTALSPRERAVMKWNGNPYRMDGGNGGAEEDDGAFYLLPYWMGRYYGFL